MHNSSQDVSPTGGSSRLRLSGRERQIMEVLWARGPVSVADVVAALPDPAGYNAVRRTLSILEQKGATTHVADGPRYLYAAALPVPESQPASRALHSVIRTFFSGNLERAVATLLDSDEARVDTETLDRLAALIDDARSRAGEPSETPEK